MCEDDNKKLLTSTGLRLFCLEYGGFKRREEKNNYYEEVDRQMKRVLEATRAAFCGDDFGKKRRIGKRAQPNQLAKAAMNQSAESDPEDLIETPQEKQTTKGRTLCRHETIVNRKPIKKKASQLSRSHTNPMDS